MMSGAPWVRDELVACGWQVQVADARKVKTVAPLAAKTDKVDARLTASRSWPAVRTRFSSSAINIASTRAALLGMGFPLRATDSHWAFTLVGLAT